MSCYINCLTSCVYDHISQDNSKPAVARDRWVGKVNFVEIRSFWHVFRSFDRMWSFYILCLQVLLLLSPILLLPFFMLIHTRCDADDKIWKAMIIMAWDGGQPSSVFGADVIKKVLSVFITAAIMKLGQGWSMSLYFHKFT